MILAKWINDPGDLAVFRSIDPGDSQGKGQIAVVKRAAAILGVPYQTYLKQVVFRQALADIEQATAVLAPEAQGQDSGRQSRSRTS